MQTFNWVIKFDNGNQMGGGLKVKTFEEARQHVTKVIEDLKKNLGYKVVEFTIRQGKLIITHPVGD